MVDVLSHVVSVTKINHVSGQSCLYEPSPNKNSGHQDLSDLTWLAIFLVCCHELLQGEVTTVHYSTGRRQLEGLYEEFSSTLSHVLLPLADFNP